MRQLIDIMQLRYSHIRFCMYQGYTVGDIVDTLVCFCEKVSMIFC